MIIENSFVVSVPPEQALDVLTDVPSIAPCIPGVNLTGGDTESGYTGTASVRLGPVALTFAGEAKIVEIDRAAGTARVEAGGADQKGRGRATATVDFSLAEADGGTKVDVHSDVTLTGSIAQYGRASGLIKEVANQIIADFTTNLESRLAQTGEPETVAGEQVAAPSEPREISGFAIFFRALWAMVRRLFGAGRD